jgi:hypothetical protein
LGDGTVVWLKVLRIAGQQETTRTSFCVQHGVHELAHRLTRNLGGFNLRGGLRGRVKTGFIDRDQDGCGQDGQR